MSGGRPQPSLRDQRDDYLYLFARWLSLTPAEVDSLTIRDFTNLLAGIKQELEAQHAV